MSVWSSIKGVVSFKREDTSSLRTIAFECFGDEYCISDVSKYDAEYIVINFTITFCQDGDEAVKCVQLFNKKLKERSPTSQTDLEATIRFIY